MIQVDDIWMEVNVVYAEVVGGCHVIAAVFGSGQHTWRLQFQIKAEGIGL